MEKRFERRIEFDTKFFFESHHICEFDVSESGEGALRVRAGVEFWSVGVVKSGDFGTQIAGD